MNLRHGRIFEQLLKDVGSDKPRSASNHNPAMRRLAYMRQIE
jgi:hypothetical protein